MKKQFKILFAFLIFFSLILLVGCDDVEPEKKYIADFTVLNNFETIYVGDEINFTISYDEAIDVHFSVVANNGLCEIKSIKGNLVTITCNTKGTEQIQITEDNSEIKKTVTIEILELVVQKEITEEEKKIFNEFVQTIPVETATNLPLLEGYNIVYEFENGISKTGEVSKQDENQTYTGKVMYVTDYGTLESELTITVFGTFINEMANAFLSQFPISGIDGNMTIKKRFDDYGGTYITFEFSDPEIFNDKGKYNRPFNDTYITVTYTVKTSSPKAKVSFSDQLLVKGKDFDYKNAQVQEWIEKIYKENSVLSIDATFPTYCDEYEATIQWFDKDGKTPELAKLAVDPILGDIVVLTVRCTYPNSKNYKDFVLDYRVWNKVYNNTWEKIEDFVNSSNVKSVRTYTYKYRVMFDNFGYLPFYCTENADINKEYLCEYTYGYVCTGIKKKSTEYITIHDTAGTSPTADALQHAQGQYNKNLNKANTESISWHFTVGNDGIYQSLPLDEVGYHAGDGSREYGNPWMNGEYYCLGGGNRNSIGIETCVNDGSDYSETMRILAKLVAELLIEFNLSVDRVKQHFNFSGKYCPRAIKACDRWDELLNLIKWEYFAKTELSGVDFVYTSLSANNLDNSGHIINSNKEEMTVKYKVKCTFENESKEFTFQSIIEKFGNFIEAY